MHDDELWQVFAQNGQPIIGASALDNDFNTDHSFAMGTAHVWLWKMDGTKLQILLQKRALTKKNQPGYYHISAGGHINAKETAVDAAVRETNEELGVVIDPNLLYLVNVTRLSINATHEPNTWRDFAYVYLYQLHGDEEFSFDDGEVDSVEWRDIEDFQMMVESADEHKLVDSGMAYFESLISTLKRITRDEESEA